MKKIIILTVAPLFAVALNCAGEKKDPFLFLPLGQEEGKTTTVTTPNGTEVTIVDNSQPSEDDVDFDNTHEIPINITIGDPDGPVEDSLIVVGTNPTEGGNESIPPVDSDAPDEATEDSESTSPTEEIAIQPPSENSDGTEFQGITDENGNVEGVITVPNPDESVEIEIGIGEESVVIEVPTNTPGIDIEVTVGVPVVAQPPKVDTDSDGIADDGDDYPNDPTRAKKVVNPFTVVAFEESYPDVDDLDFNDYVVAIQGEQDLNAEGKVVRIRSKYTHLAKGQGHNHSFHVTIPNSGSGLLVKNIYKVNGSLEDSSSEKITSAAGIHVFCKLSYDKCKSDDDKNSGSNGTSNSTKGGSGNTKAGDTFVPGQSAQIEYILDTPVSGSVIGGAPFDVFIKVINTKERVHLSGKYFDANGSDKYLNAKGLPWAISIPARWNWPTEGVDIHDAYPTFSTWYLSGSNDAKDWYLNPVSQKVFAAFQNSVLSAFIGSRGISGPLLFGIGILALLGLGLILGLHKKKES